MKDTLQQLFGDLPIVRDTATAHRFQNAVIEAIEGKVNDVTLGLFHGDSSAPLVVRVVSVKEWGGRHWGFPGLRIA